MGRWAETTAPGIAVRALAAARAGEVHLDRLTGRRQPSAVDWQIARAWLLGEADARPDDIEVVLAVGLVSIGAARCWSEEAGAQRKAMRQNLTRGALPAREEDDS
ncbi:MAG TPA: hypothetical protein VGV93_10490 [Acidimicrobiales bacterium]|nr:hypothetical protein [Acidimicrobiales bacterium]